MDADGSNVVATGVPLFHSFAWSPDGTRLGFSDGRDILVMNIDTFAVEPLISTPFDDLEPSWSPDGQHIAFISGEVSFTNDGSQDVYMADADGSNVTNITRSPANDRMPAWSPDGSQLVFLSLSPTRGLALTGYWDIATIRRDGTGFTRLTMIEKDHDNPVWQP
jgi:Tol biopolymer transport system component